MKKIRAFLSVLLCLTMLWACFAPAAAIDAQSGRTTVTAKAPRRFSGYQAPATLDTTLPWDAFFTAVETVLFTDATTVDVTGLGIPYTEENRIYAFRQAYVLPQMLDITGWELEHGIVGADEDEGIEGVDTITSVIYNGDSAANAARKAECEAVMFRLLRGIQDNDGLNGYDKVLLVHDRLAAWAAYDMSESIPDSSDSFNAYGALVNGVAVCQGYSMAFGWMLDKLGIENYYVTSDTIHHGWTKVILDGNAYYVDVTFDDPTYDVPGRILHKNLLVPFEVFKPNHYDAEDYDQTVTDTTYVESFDKNSKSEIVRIRGNYYFMKYNANARATLVRYSPTSETETVLWTVTTLTYSNQTHESAANKGSNWLYNPKMTAIGTKVLYTDGKALMAFDVTKPGDAPVKVFNLSGTDPILEGLTVAQIDEFLLQGVQQKDGKLYVTAFNDAQFDADTVEKYTIEIDYCQHENKTVLEQVNPVDCTETGSVKYVCEDCRKVWTEETAAGNHVFGEPTVVAATCCSVEVTTRACTKCDFVETTKGTEFAPDNHPADKVIPVPEVAATCQKVGYTAGTYCEACGNNVEGRQEIPKDPTNHVETYVAVAGYPASCTNPGQTPEIRCSGCNEIVTESAPIGARGHDYQETVVEATCTSQGYTLKECSRCHDKIKTDFTPKKEHETVEVAEVVPTCAEDGFTAGLYCTVCESYVEGHVRVFKDRTNHVGFAEVNRPATCTKDGVEGAMVCTGCGRYQTDASGKEIRGTVIPALGHDFPDDGIILKEPTCTDTGLRKQTCDRCHEIVTSKIDKLGHLDLDEDLICDRCQKNLNEDACPYCNQIHSGPFAFLVNFFHKIFYLVFGPKKAKVK